MIDPERGALGGRTPDAPVPPRLLRAQDLLEEWDDEAKDAHQAYLEGQVRGPVTGLARLDRELGSALCTGLHVLHGEPGSGKTAFALQIAANCGNPAVFLSTEMGPMELMRRIVARVTSTPLGRLRSGELNPADMAGLGRRAVEAVPQLALGDATTTFATPHWLEQAALATRGDTRHLLIVIDSVHSWAEASATGLPEYEALNAALASLRAIAQALGCPVLAVAERNRLSMAKGGLSAGAGTRKLEYGAETVLDLSRQLDIVPDAAGEIPATLGIAKNRNGAAGGRVPMRFHGALQRFREVSR